MIDTVALKEKVLDLAIRGKLVPQDPNDEPASVLLERIRAQKQQMVKDGKLKAKDIKDDSIIFVGEDNLHYEKFADGTVECIEDEIPFELPCSWSWCRLGVLYAHNTGKALNSSDTTGIKLTYITTSNLYWDRFELENLREMPFTESEIEKCTVRKGDLLVCEGGDIGRSAIWLFDEEVRIQNHIHRLRSYIDLSNRFYYYVLYLWKLMERIGGQGIGLQGFSSKALHKLIVPLPPQNEQIAIVEKLDLILNSVDKLDKLSTDFSIDIDCIKKRILDLAIRGKLVPQSPNDEPASVLLDRIRKEKEELIKAGKIKRDKKESVIFKGEDNSYYLIQNKKAMPADETIVFDLPNSWCWTTLPTIANVELGKTLDRAKNTGTLYPYLRSVNIKWGDIDLSDLNETRFEDDELEKYSVIKNDLLICEGGDVGRCCVWNIDEVFLYQNALHRARMYANIEPKFYQYVLMSYESKGILKRISNGVTIKHLTGTTLSFMPIPLPPVDEQLRIIETIELLFAQLDAIKESIN